MGRCSRVEEIFTDEYYQNINNTLYQSIISAKSMDENPSETSDDERKINIINQAESYIAQYQERHKRLYNGCEDTEEYYIISNLLKLIKS